MAEKKAKHLTAPCIICGDSEARLDIEPSRAVVTCEDCSASWTLSGEIVRQPSEAVLKKYPWCASVFSIPKSFAQDGSVKVFHGHSDDADRAKGKLPE